ALEEGGRPALGDLGGLRPWLEERGMSLEGFLVADLSRNFQGGLSTGRETLRSLFELSFTLDTEPLFGFAGGTLFVDVQSQHGRHGTELLAGDFQGFSNLDAPGFTALYELWYEQLLAGGRLRLKLGKIDASNEFAFVENGAEMLNSSAGFSPTILGFTTYPNPATGAVLFASPADWLYLGGGVFDGATQAGKPTGTRGPATLFGDPDDLLVVAEVGIHGAAADRRLQRLAFGITNHSGVFDRVDGSGLTEDGATSYYLVLDQRVADRYGRSASRDASESVPGIDGFLQLGWTSKRISPVDLHAGAGLVWSGYVPGRVHDRFGFLATWVRFSAPARAAGSFSDPSELACELFYRVHLTPWLWLQPDLQYIVNPGGDGLRDALVGTLRLELAL
ncbi:MAG: carbohydrate porin, partial [Verrucomicrobia subdivision 3 bacterium]|nr:carbohydrate porin [Limisphaerales bacterium]